MTLPFFLHDGPLAVDGTLSLDGDEGRHAVTVKRLRVGERLLLGDGLGRVATAEIVSLGKQSLQARVLALAEQERNRPRLVVVQAVPKGERAELAVEVLTEIGADLIVPWAASRCVAVWRGERAVKSLARWRRTARESAKQARRAWLPEVADLAATEDVTGLIADADVAIVLHEEATGGLSELPLSSAEVIVLIVGPEGGITAEELAAFGAAHQVRLGAEVLRTSTAGVAAAAAVLSRTRRWQFGQS